MISVSVPYRGSTPAEVEESIVVKIEESIQDIQGIKKITSTAAEGAGSVNIEVDKGYDSRELLDDIKNRVDSINSFPVETEKPVFNLAKPRGEVITAYCANNVNLGVVEIAWAGLANHEAERHHDACAFLLQILGNVSCAVKA